MGAVANATPLTAAALIYVVFTIPLIRVASRLEKKRKRKPPKRAGSDGGGLSPESEQDLHSADIAGQLP